MAVAEANKTYYGKYIFSLEVRNMEGPWGTGARQAVDLVFNKKSLAIISAVDGRNAHLAEQVSAKARVIFLNAGSGDPSLSRAFVPWYFSCIPDDRQVAEVLVDYSLKEHFREVAIISDNGYDSRIAAESLRQEFIRNGSDPEIFSYPEINSESGKNIKYFTTKDTKASTKEKKGGYDLISTSGKGNVFTIIIGRKDVSLKIAENIRLTNNTTIICIRSSKPEEEFLSEDELKRYEGLLFFSGGLIQSGNFTSSFLKEYGYKPGPAAVFTQDAVNIFTAAAVQSEGDQQRIIDNMSGNKFTGISGEISFDEKGNINDRGRLLKVNNGRLVPVKQ
jgi:ABC-type branched-subunit amino acid transport system substrate-binding protein